MSAIILSFMKVIRQWQAFKNLVGKNTALTKFHVSIHLMTFVDRERIVSKKICGNFDFMPLSKSH